MRITPWTHWAHLQEHNQAENAHLKHTTMRINNISSTPQAQHQVQQAYLKHITRHIKHIKRPRTFYVSANPQPDSQKQNPTCILSNECQHKKKHLPGMTSGQSTEIESTNSFSKKGRIRLLNNYAWSHWPNELSWIIFLSIQFIFAKRKSTIRKYIAILWIFTILPFNGCLVCWCAHQAHVTLAFLILLRITINLTGASQLCCADAASKRIENEAHISIHGAVSTNIEDKCVVSTKSKYINMYTYIYIYIRTHDVAYR